MDKPTRLIIFIALGIIIGLQCSMCVKQQAVYRSIDHVIMCMAGEKCGSE